MDFDSRFDVALAMRVLEGWSFVPGLRNEFLTGLGTVQWGNVRWLDPVSIAGVLGSSQYSMAWAATAALLVVFGAVRWLARSFGVPSGTSSIAGLLAAAIAVGPGVVPVVLPDQFRIVPTFPVIAAVAAITLGSFERVGTTTGRRQVAHGVTVATASSYLVVAQTHYLVLPAFVCTVGALAVLGHRILNGASIRAQVILVSLLFGAWWATGVVSYVRGFLGYVAAVELGDSFSWTAAPLGSLVTLPMRTWFPQSSSDVLRWGAAACVIVGCVTGGARWSSRRGRCMTATVSVLAAILAYRVSQRWWPRELGPTSDYLAWTSIPLLAVAMAIGGVAVASRLARSAAAPLIAVASRLALAAVLVVLVVRAPRLDPAGDPFDEPEAAGWG
ncbi:MAG: hypothetical protein ACKN99_02800, partial [Gemmatimonadota bacterium]